MSFDPQAIINSRFGVGLALLLSRITPPRVGYQISNFVAERIAARRDWNLVRAARANQWVVSGGQLDSQQLDERVRAMFRHTGRAIYDLNRYLAHRDALEGIVQFSPAAQEIIDRSREGSGGAVVVTLHLGNFDLAVRVGSLRGLKGMVFTLPELDGGYEMQYEMRKAVGMEIVPATRENLRQAVQRLHAGEYVFTGIDRPLPDTRYRQEFFGRLAGMPMHHITLALKANAPVIVSVAVWQPDGCYHLLVSEPICMQSFPDRRTELVKNTEAVLKVAEGYIRQYPEQWSMFFPVWPEALDEV